MTTVVIVDDAAQQLAEIVAWWAEHRPAAPTLVLDEFAECVDLLEGAPETGARFQRTHVPDVRRLVMTQTKHLIYYVHDAKNAVVYIIAIWGAPKGGEPPLRAPPE